MESLKEKMAKSLVRIDWKYLRAPEPAQELCTF